MNELTVGETIRKLRKEKKLSQKKLAELTQLNEVTIRSYEANKYKPKLVQLKKIATALNVTLDDFIDIEQPVNPLLDGFPKNRDEAIEWKEKLLIQQFRMLNDVGMSKAIEAIEDLTYIEKYTNKDTKS